MATRWATILVKAFTAGISERAAGAAAPPERCIHLHTCRTLARRRSGRYRFELDNWLLYGALLRAPAVSARARQPDVGNAASESGPPRVADGRVPLGPPARSTDDSGGGTATWSTDGGGTAARSTDDSGGGTAARSTDDSGDTVALLPGYLYDVTSAAPTADPSARLPSVTRVLQATMSDESRAALLRWETAMVEKHGRHGFDVIKQAMFATGRGLHNAVEAHLTGRPEVPLSPAIDGYWRSVRPVLNLVDSEQVAAIETPITHSQLGYRGVVDCVAPFRSAQMVIEWKTARRPKTRLADTFDNPVQAAAYLGAYNFTHRHAQVQRAAVVVAYEYGSPATVHVMSPALCRHYWTVWLARLRRYKQAVDCGDPT